MNLFTKIILILSLSLSCVSQVKVNNGSLKYNFGGPISGYSLLGVASNCSVQECRITFNEIAGKFWNGKLQAPDRQCQGLGPDDFRGCHSVVFETGPLLTGNYADGATFGPGGVFHLRSEQIFALPCGTYSADPTLNQACTYDAHWVNSEVIRKDLSDGTHVYTFQGELFGVYFDPPLGKRIHIRAFFQITSGSWNNLFSEQQGQQSWSGGTLTIYTGGPQG